MSESERRRRSDPSACRASPVCLTACSVQRGMCPVLQICRNVGVLIPFQQLLLVPCTRTAAGHSHIRLVTVCHVCFYDGAPCWPGRRSTVISVKSFGSEATAEPKVASPAVYCGQLTFNTREIQSSGSFCPQKNYRGAYFPQKCLSVGIPLKLCHRVTASKCVERITRHS